MLCRSIGLNHLAPPSFFHSIHSLIVARTAIVFPLLVYSLLGLGIICLSVKGENLTTPNSFCFHRIGFGIKILLLVP